MNVRFKIRSVLSVALLAGVTLAGCSACDSKPTLDAGVNDAGKFEIALHSLVLQKNEYYDLENSIALTGSSFEKTKISDLAYVSHDGQDWFVSPYADFATQSDKQNNAAAMPMGQGELASFNCPEFKQHPPFGYFNYFPNQGYPYIDEKPVQLGGIYCLVNHDNSKLFKFKVVGKTNDTVTINSNDLGLTGVKTYGCSDGLCNDKAEVFCVGCNVEDLPSAKKTFQLQAEAQVCLDRYLGTHFAPLRLVAYPKSLDQCAATGAGSCMVRGHGGPYVQTWGFEGLRYGGEDRTSLDNIRLDLHENMHNYSSLAKLNPPSWFDEGMAVQTATRINCGPNTMPDHWRADDTEYIDLRNGKTTLSALGFSAQTNPHGIGSLFMKGLEIDYACGQDCVAKIWKKLANDFGGSNLQITSDQIIKATNKITGKDVTPLLKLLGVY